MSQGDARPPSKYDLSAETYSSRYVDANAIANRQRELVATWGSPTPPGARILELGCADGFVTAVFARA
jgi:hypothetical protein